MNGFNIVSGGTDCHMVLIDLTTKKVTRISRGNGAELV